jgi:opacity protein-like surface antigen
MIKVLAPLLATSMMLMAGVAFAADPATPSSELPAESGWTFAAAPYLWMAGIEGTIGQFGLPPVDVDASFIDVLENFDIGAMMVGEARYDRFGVAFDFQYVKVSAGADTPLGLLSDKVEVTSETLTVLVAAEYRVVETNTASLDLMAGGRLWSVDTDLDPQGGPADPLFFSDGDTWVDPIVGARGRVNLSPEFYLTGWGMIGGFGVASDLTWDVMGGAGYAVSDRVSLIAGYRALSVDYENDGFQFDVVQHGPILGARISF